MSHTPPPWDVEAVDEQPYGTYRILNYGHDAMRSRSFDAFDAQFEGNRVLIEAAPDLLDAAKVAVEELDTLLGLRSGDVLAVLVESTENAWNVLVKAIAKAEGRQT